MLDKLSEFLFGSVGNRIPKLGIDRRSPADSYSTESSVVIDNELISKADGYSTVRGANENSCVMIGEE